MNWSHLGSLMWETAFTSILIGALGILFIVASSRKTNGVGRYRRLERALILLTGIALLVAGVLRFSR